MHGHYEQLVKNDVLSHPAYTKVWQHLDEVHPSFDVKLEMEDRD